MRKELIPAVNGVFDGPSFGDFARAAAHLSNQIRLIGQRAQSIVQFLLLAG